MQRQETAQEERRSSFAKLFSQNRRRKYLRRLATRMGSCLWTNDELRDASSRPWICLAASDTHFTYGRPERDLDSLAQCIEESEKAVDRISLDASADQRRDFGLVDPEQLGGLCLGELSLGDHATNSRNERSLGEGEIGAGDVQICKHITASPLKSDRLVIASLDRATSDLRPVPHNASPQP